MGSGHITEVLRDLEEESKEKEILLKHYQKNEQNKKIVDQIIHNEKLNLKCEKPSTGNAWGNAENLRENIEKLNKEISLYEDIKKPKSRFR